MTQIKISILNDSHLLTDAQVQHCIDAWQTQITRDFAPEWKVEADLVFVPQGQQPEPGSWWLSFFDDSAHEVRLGFHDITPEGLPVGKVFVQDEINNNLKWSVTASHELLEMLIDPDINRTVLIEDRAGIGKLYTLEVCDAVEDDADGYLIGDVAVSNFVLPAYFRQSPLDKAFDHQGVLAGPLPALRAGGFLSQCEIRNGGGWTISGADATTGALRGQVRGKVPGSRADRRLRPRAQWQPAGPRLRTMPPA